MRGFFVGLTLAGALAFPLMSQAMDDMTCADFTAMDAPGQMDAVSMMGDSMAAGDTMAPADAMAGGDMMAADEMTKAVSTTCADHPDMMVGEAMKMAN